MKLLLVVDVFSPGRTAAAVQMRDLAVALGHLGHQCAVVTPDDRISERFVLEQGEAFRILKIRSAPLKRINLLRRAVNEIRLSPRMWAGYESSPMRTESWDGVVFYSPSIFFGRLVAKLKSLHRCPAYLVLRDIFPDWAAEMGIMRKGPPYWLFSAFAKHQYAVADRIGVESSRNLGYLGSRERQAEVLTNWIDTGGGAAPAYELPEELQGRKLFVYAGSMGVAQDVDNLFRLARRLEREREVRFLFVGSGTERPRLEEAARQLELGNVVFHRELDPQQLRGLLRYCHVGLVSLDRRLRTHNVPGKLLSYLEAGLPVLCSLNPGNELKAILERSDAGLVCWNGEDEALADAARRLISGEADRMRMASAARRLCQERFSALDAARQIAGFFESRWRGGS